ncbi:fungal specific transcription factor domain-containing protein [Verticillium alfalfae VaMs.102]|uniref:Fungal specific transcription factor domain-containing protein n=1 Tax=Verticillium alfalfae (strain VaMs.102 / ATCC MYA-4576 / FGSC 10136) TaxID=526221 RepID=C9SMS0_VERA1|nr:fungal specific transcription factor domain-containing protein [Verticillium alfalfae VaMs.102]EEY20085.1 fungal specific transcription factor domain-containing protein [Verticillium alfalfae VaMs.102]
MRGNTPTVATIEALVIMSASEAAFTVMLEDDFIVAW